MDELQRQVRRASRRMFCSSLLRHTTWSLLAALLLALVAVIARKLFPLPVDGRVWWLAWLAGSLAAGLLAGCLWTIAHRPDQLDAAIEVDLRYGLQERVSSALTLSQTAQTTAMGRALVEDARQRVQRIDLRERFQPAWNWHPVLPVLAALATFLVGIALPDAKPDATAATPATENTSQQVRRAMQELRQRLAARKQAADAKQYDEAEALRVKLEQTARGLERSDADRKKALVKLNNLSKEVADRRAELQGGQQLRDQLKQLTKSVPDGPADRIARALQSGDLQTALQELQQLSDRLRRDDLTAAERQQLARQLQQLATELNKSLGARQELIEKQQALQQKIDTLRQQGDLAAAGQLQQRLDQLQHQLDNLDTQNPALGRLESLARQLQNCEQALQNGDGRQSAQQLDQLAENLQQLQSQLENLETLDAMMTEIGDAKSAMSCSQCGGAGCTACRAAGAQDALANMPAEAAGNGMAAGTGSGTRPEAETATGGYRTRVGGNPRAGEAVRTGDAGGPNVAGTSRAVIQQEIASAVSDDPDPLAEQHLPRREREQTREYFELLRKGGGNDE